MDAVLTRLAANDQGTFGVLDIEGFRWFSLELPDRNNKRSRSRIPAGDYNCRWVCSRKHGFVYWLETVPGRSGILIHAGNYAGDVTQGWRTHSNGCILLGNKMGYLGKQKAVLCSRFAMTDFHRVTDGTDYLLTIQEVF